MSSKKKRPPFHIVGSLHQGYPADSVGSVDAVLRDR